jgi:hypothetical protein
MSEPYQAVGLIQTMRGIRRRDEIMWNIEHISHLIKAASWLSSMDLPVRLICIPEGGLQGLTDEVFDSDHVQFARECAIDIPGPETDALGKLARQWNAYLKTRGIRAVLTSRRGAGVHRGEGQDPYGARSR